MALAYNTKIVRDGLVLHLDAANVKSYPGSGTTWTDMKGSVAGSMNGGIVYTDAESGAMIFDGTDDNCEFNLNGNVNVSQGTTICFWVYRESTSTSQKNIISTRFGGGGGQLYIGSRSNQIFSYYNGLSTPDFVATSWPRLKHVYLVVRLNNDGSITHISYSDSGREENTSPVRTGFSSGDNNLLKLSGDLEYFEGKMYGVQWYNRELMDSEIQQNFFAYRGRYGI